MVGFVINKLLKTEVIEVYKEACKNDRNQQEVCRLCVDACEPNAIELINQIPKIEETKCIDCGACVSVCPVNAVDHLQKPYAKIANYISQFPHAEITCSQVEEFNRGIKIPCLLYLDVALLIQYANKREELHMYTKHCRFCRKFSEEKIIDHLQSLEQHLESLGVNVEIKTVDRLPLNDHHQTVDALSRRDLLRRFSFPSLRDFILPSKKEKEKWEVEVDVKELSIKERMQIKKRMINQIFETGANLLDFSFHVDEKCNGCNVCESICPTGAIYWEKDGEAHYLTLNKKLCIECDKCLACPVQALKKINKTNEVAIEKKILTTKISAHCTDCGEIFKAQNKNEDSCYFCIAKKQKSTTAFFNSILD